MANDEPSMKIEGCTFERQPPDLWTKWPKRMAMQVAMRRSIEQLERSIDRAASVPFRPATPLTGLALRLFAVSNGFHECRSDRID